jgi:hypothetical protein
LLAALLSALGVPISVALLLPLVGAAALFVLLRNYYAGRPLVTEIAVADPLAQNAIVNLGESAER